MVWSFSGVRPLFDDGAGKAQEATRDYVLRTDAPVGEAAVVNIFGGKITTYRRLAEAVLSEIGRQIGERGRAWTAGARLPGGDMDVEGLPDLAAELRRDRPFLPAGLAGRLARLYGTRGA
jgi:glycerol-3-phosphate dehydrogenase